MRRQLIVYSNVLQTHARAAQASSSFAPILNAFTLRLPSHAAHCNRSRSREKCEPQGPNPKAQTPNPKPQTPNLKLQPQNPNPKRHARLHDVEEEHRADLLSARHVPKRFN